MSVNCLCSLLESYTVLMSNVLIKACLVRLQYRKVVYKSHT